MPNFRTNILVRAERPSRNEEEACDDMAQMDAVRTIRYYDGSYTHMTHCPLDREAADFDLFEDLIIGWRRAWRGRCLPTRKTLRFSDLKGWHTHIALSVFKDRPGDPYFQIVGEDMSERHNREITRKHFSDFAPAAFNAGFQAHFSAIREEALIGRCWGKMVMEERRHIMFSAIELPLAGADGAVDGILHGFLADLGTDG